ncbi:hypothetical protein, partial [Conchiformibius kuhniae]
PFCEIMRFYFTVGKIQGWVGAKRKPNKIHKFSEKCWVFTSFQPNLRLLDKTLPAGHRTVDSRIRGNDGILMILIENYGRAVIPECGYDGTGLDDAL